MAAHVSLGTHLRVVAVLIDFPAVYLVGLVHVDGGLNVLRGVEATRVYSGP